uniref:Uncharacterized protein n=1 Tax=Schistocephalus solidus TaxID=70667 RepID=A0A0X3PTC3_SCHSO
MHTHTRSEPKAKRSSCQVKPLVLVCPIVHTPKMLVHRYKRHGGLLRPAVYKHVHVFLVFFRFSACQYLHTTRFIYIYAHTQTKQTLFLEQIRRTTQDLRRITDLSTKVYSVAARSLSARI